MLIALATPTPRRSPRDPQGVRRMESPWLAHATGSGPGPRPPRASRRPRGDLVRGRLDGQAVQGAAGREPLQRTRRGNAPASAGAPLGEVEPDDGVAGVAAAVSRARGPREPSPPPTPGADGERDEVRRHDCAALWTPRERGAGCVVLDVHGGHRARSAASAAARRCSGRLTVAAHAPVANSITDGRPIPTARAPPRSRSTASTAGRRGAPMAATSRPAGGRRWRAAVLQHRRGDLGAADVEAEEAALDHRAGRRSRRRARPSRVPAPGRGRRRARGVRRVAERAPRRRRPCPPPATRKTTSRAALKTGRVSVTRGTSGSSPAPGRPRRDGAGSPQRRHAGEQRGGVRVGAEPRAARGRAAGGCRGVAEPRLVGVGRVVGAELALARAAADGRRSAGSGRAAPRRTMRSWRARRRAGRSARRRATSSRRSCRRRARRRARRRRRGVQPPASAMWPPAHGDVDQQVGDGGRRDRRRADVDHASIDPAPRERGPVGRVAQQRLAHALAEDPRLAARGAEHRPRCSLPSASRARGMQPARAALERHGGARGHLDRHAGRGRAGPCSTGSSVELTSWRRARACRAAAPPRRARPPGASPGARRASRRTARRPPPSPRGGGRRPRSDLPQRGSQRRRVEGGGDALAPRRRAQPGEVDHVGRRASRSPARREERRRIRQVLGVEQHDLASRRSASTALLVAVGRPHHRGEVGHDQRVDDRVQRPSSWPRADVELDPLAPDGERPGRVVVSAATRAPGVERRAARLDRADDEPGRVIAANPRPAGSPPRPGRKPGRRSRRGS